MLSVKKRLPLLVSITTLAVLLSLFVRAPQIFPGGDILMHKLKGKATISDRLSQYGPQSQARWQPYFKSANVSWPPQKVVLVGLKQEKQLQVYAANSRRTLHLIRTFPILAASGKLGPKLREGDYQVPEGVYGIESLNPNSAYHLALRISYPSEQDTNQAASEGRTNLGGDIMIHGSNASVGCLAMGDETAEDLFVLAAETGIGNVEVLLCPLDFRKETIPTDANRPKWIKERYAQLASQLQQLPA